MSDNGERLVAAILRRMDGPVTRSMADNLAKVVGVHRLRDQVAFLERSLIKAHSRLDELQGLLTGQERLLADLRDGLRSLRRPVERVDLGDCSVFVYADDHMVQYVRGAARRSQADLEDEPVHRLLAWYGDNERSACYVEVGCNFGVELVRTAKYVVGRGLNVPMAAFDLGDAAALVPFTLQDNDLAGRVTFERMGASSSSRPVMVFGEAAHSENNRIVNPGEPELAFPSYIVPATRLDDYLDAHGLVQDPIFKIDTQGAEHEVLAGFRRALRDRAAAGVCEFTPWALATRVSPVEFLDSLEPSHFILDLGCDRSRCDEVRKADFPAFVQRIDTSHPRWTDLLLLPRKLPKLREVFLGGPRSGAASR